MAAKFQVIALSSIDPDGSDTQDEPNLVYPDACRAAEELKAQGKAFRVRVLGQASEEELQSLRDLGAMM